MAAQGASSKRTTSIVDISEIEDDDEALEMEQRLALAPAGEQERRARSHSPAAAAAAAAQLYLYHEDLQPQQRVASLLSSMGALGARSTDVSPGQTLTRPLSSNPLQAIEYRECPAGQLQGRNSPERRPLQAAPLRKRAPKGGRESGSGGTGAGAGIGGIGGIGINAASELANEPEPQKANLGTLTGVYFPCVQNIFGVILFIRMVWIVGTAGVPTALALVSICCCVTFTTSISLSAIATNGIVPAGGSYFMISRSLGPECGGAVGTLFFLGTTVAGAMYITGAVEIMLNYMAPSWGLFGDFQRDVNIMYHNIRVYGTLLLLLVGLMVWIGVKFVSRLAPVALFCVLFSILSIFLGIFVNHNGRSDLLLCVVGDRLVTLKGIPFVEEQAFSEQLHLGRLNGSSGGGGGGGSASGSAEERAQFELRRTRHLCSYEKLRYIFCPDSQRQTAAAADTAARRANDRDQQQQADGGANAQEAAAADEQPDGMDERQATAASAGQLADLFKRPPNMSNCDPYFRQNRERIHLERAVPGLSSGVLFRNLKPRFRSKGTAVSYEPTGEAAGQFNLVFVDIGTTFTILISIYFPSCTGILAGSNRSGDLADAQRSIPRGTIAAQLTTSFVYLSSICLFGATFNNLFIRDKFGESMGGQLAVTQIAWPEPYFILVGGLLSTLGASLQSLVGAPRILQGIAKDDVIPCFRRFAKLSKRGEPETAILFTLAIAELAVLIGNLDFIAPILTISLVMCYFFINLACTLHSLLGSPNWRPRFKYFHWSISLLGCLLCLFVMVVSSWLYFLLAICLALAIYKYIEFCGAKKEWGDGKQGLALSAATYNLLRLRTTEPHTKNWRPQLLLFCKLKPKLDMEPPFCKAQLAAAQLALSPADGGGGGRELSNPEQRHQHQHEPEQQQQQQQQQLDALDGLDQLALAHPKLLTFASQLKAGKGLTLVSAIIEGDYRRAGPGAARARRTLQAEVQRERVRGFADVLVADTIHSGLTYQLQTAGLGGLKHNTVVLGWPQRWRKPLLPPRPQHQATPGASLGASDLETAAGCKRPSLKQKGQPRAASASSSSATAAAAAVETRAHLFIELMRNVQVSQNALLVVKGVDCWPESCDKLGGTIDVWWIVNDGGLLMLLPHLLRQHRTWRGCQLRIFTVAQAGDNAEQMRADLARFLYHLRIDAKLDIVVMTDTEISDYAYERTLMMEQRGELFRRLQTQRKQSILLEQEIAGRLISFRIRKPSLCDFEETVPFQADQEAAEEEQQQAGEQQQPGAASEALELRPSPAHKPQVANATLTAHLRPDEANVRRMHTALSLNELILRRSKAAKLVIINLPGAPKESTAQAENNYMEFIEVLTDKLERVLLVQNGGREVITIHS